MGDYATSADVQPRVSARTIDANSEPTATEVTQWCTDAEAQIEGALVGGGAEMPAAGSTGATIVKVWVVDYAAALTRIAWEDTERDESLEEKIEAFNELIKDIQANPAKYDAMLNGTSDASSVRALGYVLNNSDGKTIEDGDFDPTFTIGMEF